VGAMLAVETVDRVGCILRFSRLVARSSRPRSSTRCLSRAKQPRHYLLPHSALSDDRYRLITVGRSWRLSVSCDCKLSFVVAAGRATALRNVPYVGGRVVTRAAPVVGGWSCRKGTSNQRRRGSGLAVLESNFQRAAGGRRTIDPTRAMLVRLAMGEQKRRPIGLGQCGDISFS